MATRFWVGGTGNWDAATTTHWAATSGGAGGATVPTSSDTVTFDVNGNVAGGSAAYTVTITATANCSDLTIGFTGTTKVTITGSGFINIFGNLNMAGGTAQITINLYSGRFIMAATTTGKTITMNGIALGNGAGVFFNGSGGGWTLQDDLNVGSSFGNIQIQNGTLNTNGKTVTCLQFNNNTGTSTLTCGASTFNISTIWDVSVGTVTLNAGTSTINLGSSSAVAQFKGAGKTYNIVNIAPLIIGTTNLISGANTFSTLSITGFSNVSSGIQITSSQTITGTITINGNSAINRILLYTTAIGTNLTITAGTVVTSFTDFKDITGAGAGSWNLTTQTTNSSGDCGGNVNITFTVASTQHWTNASSGNWSTVGNWTSRIPLPQDTAMMDKAFGSSQTVTVDMPRLAKNIDWTGATWSNTLTWTVPIAVSIFGSLTLIPNLTFAINSIAFTFEGRSTHTIDLQGVPFSNNSVLNSFGGTYSLLNDWISLTTNSNKTFSFTNGTFNDGNFNLTTQLGGAISSTCTITMGSGTWTMLGNDSTGSPWNISAGTTLNVSTGTIKLIDTSSATTHTFAGAGKTYNNLWFSNNTSTKNKFITGSNTFNNLKDDGSVSHSIVFTAGTTNTFSSWTILKNSANILTINSSTTATHSIVKIGGGTVSCDYLNIQHSIATPANTWYAGANSANNQATVTAGSGWIFTVPPISTIQGSSTITSPNTIIF